MRRKRANEKEQMSEDGGGRVREDTMKELEGEKKKEDEVKMMRKGGRQGEARKS